MKLLNFKHLLSLNFCVLLCLFLISSCTTDKENLQHNNEKPFVIEKGFLLPTSIMTQGDLYVDRHLKSISPSLEIKYLNNFIVGQYLLEFDKATIAFNNIEESDNISKINLSDILTSSELDIIESQLITSLPQLETRSCTPVYQWHNCYWRNEYNQCVACWKHVTNYPTGC